MATVQGCNLTYGMLVYQFDWNWEMNAGVLPTTELPDSFDEMLEHGISVLLVGHDSDGKLCLIPSQCFAHNKADKQEFARVGDITPDYMYAADKPTAIRDLIVSERDYAKASFLAAGRYEKLLEEELARQEGRPT